MRRSDSARILALGALFLLLASMASAASINGAWHFVFSNGQDEYPRDITIKVKGDQATATFGKETFQGTFKNGKLEFAGDHYAEEAGYTAELKVSGKLNASELKGTATWDTYELTFTATKQ